MSRIGVGRDAGISRVRMGMHDNANTYPKTFNDVVTTQTCKIREGHGEREPIARLVMLLWPGKYKAYVTRHAT
jgi:hypothetical protein